MFLSFHGIYAAVITFDKSSGPYIGRHKLQIKVVLVSLLQCLDNISK